MTKQMLKPLSFIAATLLLSACGTSQADRTVSGAGIAAGVGAASSYATGGDVSDGAVLGGAVGAVTGAVTDRDDINLD